MHEGRQYFRSQLRNLEDEIQAMATAAERLFELSVRNLSGQDPALYQVIRLAVMMSKTFLPSGWVWLK